MANPADTQPQIQGFELTYPNIYPIYKLTLKGLNLQIQSCRIAMTQGTKTRIGKRNSSVYPELIV